MIEDYKSDLDCEFLTSFYYCFLIVFEITIDTNMLRCHYRFNILKHQCFIIEIVLSFSPCVFFGLTYIIVFNIA
jgi:hypothetical protein